jgi:hypothetical protein
LSIGQALDKGLILYRDIFDHKPPLIYWLAAVFNNILAWKMLGLAAAIMATTFFYRLAEILLQKKWLAGMASLVWVIVFNLPILEGNTVNAEILFAPLVLAGAYAWFKSGVLKKTDTALINVWQEYALCLVAGISWGLAMLVKTQAVLEILAFVAPLVFLSLPEWREKLRLILTTIGGGVLVGLTVLIVSLIQGNLGAMMAAAIGYSLQYSSFSSVIDIKTMGLILIAVLAFIYWQKDKFSWANKIVVLWLLLTTGATILSGRNYAHYWLQLAGPIMVGIAMIIRELTKEKKELIAMGVLVVATGIAIASAPLLKVQEIKAAIIKEKMVNYYGNFGKYLLNKQNIFAWYVSLDSLLKENYAIAPLIQNDSNPYLLVWGNNPSLYAQTNKLPVNKYLTDYHLYDLEKEEDTLGVWLDGLVEKQPTFVVVMNNDDGSAKGRDWLEFYGYLRHNYQRIYQGEQLELWQLL